MFYHNMMYLLNKNSGCWGLSAYWIEERKRSVSWWCDLTLQKKGSSNFLCQTLAHDFINTSDLRFLWHIIKFFVGEQCHTGDFISIGYVLEMAKGFGLKTYLAKSCKHRKNIALSIFSSSNYSAYPHITVLKIGK